MMNISELRNTLAILILALMALAMLPACSTTEEEPAPADTGSGGGGSYDQCVAGCAAGDVDCRELCLREYTP